ncbi:MAG: hypothetical protein WDO72_05420 [Pseudomonadota bacterium]
MKIIAFVLSTCFCSIAFAGDAPPQTPTDPCKTGFPWVLPKVEPLLDVSEQYLLLGARAPLQLTICNCTPTTAGKPAPYVWVNVTFKVEKETQQEAGNPPVAQKALTPQGLDKAWKEAKGRTQFEFLSPSGNGVVVSRLTAPACMTAVGLSVLVMHSSKEQEQTGTFVVTK